MRAPIFRHQRWVATRLSLRTKDLDDPQTIQFPQHLIHIQELPILESVEEEDEHFEGIEEVDDGVNMKID